MREPADQPVAARTAAPFRLAGAAGCCGCWPGRPGAGYRVCQPGVRLGVLLHQVDAVDHQMGIVSTQRDLATLALVTASEDDDFVAFADLVHGFLLQDF